MQAYGRGFARAYNERWGGFAHQVTPHLVDFYAGTPFGQQRQPVLDLCCGTGQVALGFLERGYPVTGLDLSPHMLAYARQNAAAYMAASQAELVLADAADFALERRFGLVVSIYDALNHLPDLKALQGCFRSVGAALLPGGWFIFDLNTRHGLRRWNVTSVDDGGQSVVITRSSFDGTGQRARLEITGFMREPDGRYERFDETIYNTIFDIQAVVWSLQDQGWSSVHAARLGALRVPLEQPEQEARVFVVAQL
jgi:SAM-dependent methyltransferase